MHYRDINCNRESELNDLELHQLELANKNKLIVLALVTGIVIGIVIGYLLTIV